MLVFLLSGGFDCEDCLPIERLGFIAACEQYPGNEKFQALASARHDVVLFAPTQRNSSDVVLVDEFD